MSKTNYYKIEKVLVAIDLSDCSLNALDAAVVVAIKNKATVQILHVIETPVSIDPRYEQHAVNNAASDTLIALAGTIGQIKGVKTELIQVEGHVVTSVIRTAQAENSDLIVIGAHGASGIRNGFVGTNTYNVVKYATCPVMIIPAGPKITSFKNVLFPIRPVATALMMYDIVSHFIASRSSLSVLGLSFLKIERDTFLLEKIAGQIKGQLKTDIVKVYATWGNGVSIAEDTLQFANQTNPDLIVLTFILDAIYKANFIGPHTQKLINNSNTPLLIIKNSDGLLHD